MIKIDKTLHEKDYDKITEILLDGGTVSLLSTRLPHPLLDVDTVIEPDITPKRYWYYLKTEITTDCVLNIHKHTLDGTYKQLKRKRAFEINYEDNSIRALKYNRIYDIFSTDDRWVNIRKYPRSSTKKENLAEDIPLFLEVTELTLNGTYRYAEEHYDIPPKSAHPCPNLIIPLNIERFRKA